MLLLLPNDAPTKRPLGSKAELLFCEMATDLLDGETRGAPETSTAPVVAGMSAGGVGSDVFSPAAPYR